MATAQSKTMEIRIILFTRKRFAAADVRELERNFRRSFAILVSL